MARLPGLVRSFFSIAIKRIDSADCPSLLADRWFMALLVVHFFLLVVLFRCHRLIERSPPQPPGREEQRLKVATWGLFTAITAMFCVKVADLVPLVGAFIIWAAWAATVANVSASFYFHREKETTPRAAPVAPGGPM